MPVVGLQKRDFCVNYDYLNGGPRAAIYSDFVSFRLLNVGFDIQCGNGPMCSGMQ